MRMSENDIQLPEIFRTRLCEIVPGSACQDVLETFDRPFATGFRINTLLTERDRVLEELRSHDLHPHPVVWAEDAFWVEPDEREALLDSPAYREHRIYVQNLSSMIPPLVLAPQPGEHVLDLTAAPGSKTHQIACQMQGKGEIAAVEVVKSRFFKLRDNLAANGADMVRTFLKNGEHVWRNRPEYFDRVLLDAPCSSEGRFSTQDPESFAYWSPGKIKEMSRKQGRLFFSAVQSLRPGGVLVYSTCTFAPEENEVTVDKMLAKFGDALRVEPLGLELSNMQKPLEAWNRREFRDDLVSHARRILPTDTMEGFFVCKLSKNRSTL